MTIDEYRAQLVQEIKSVRDLSAARRLIEQAKATLENSPAISARDEAEFWQALNADLNDARKKAENLVEKQAAASLSQVIAAAQAVIAQHQARTGTK